MAKMTLRAARVNCNLSQKDAAQEIGVSNKTLGNWEAGTSFPKADKIQVMCDLYGISYDDLIFLPCDSLKAN